MPTVGLAVLRRTAVAIGLLAITTAACTQNTTATEPPAAAPATQGLDDRLTELSAAVADWRSAATLGEAQQAAERARNLVVGRSGPYFGDATDDGVVEGDESFGLLPGMGGEPGVATASNQCIDRDILGGSWIDPEERWRILDEAISAWTPTNNTFPTLPSHPMRVVGWATLTLATTSLDEAHEYAGHAQLHVDISRRALTACS